MLCLLHVLHAVIKFCLASPLVEGFFHYYTEKKDKKTMKSSFLTLIIRRFRIGLACNLNRPTGTAVSPSRCNATI